MRRVWLIRAGEEAEEIDRMRHAALIGLRFEKVGDARLWSHAQIEKGIADDGRAAGAAELRAILMWFANDTHAGDLVVSPNTARREVWLGIVTGDYEFSADSKIDRYHHTRGVDWLGWLDRDASWMRDQLRSIDRPLTMYELYSRDWWWKHVGSKELSSVPRSSWSKPRPERTRSTSKSTSTRTSKPTSAPRSTPRPKVAAPVLCAGSCGLVWSPYVLVDGLCADCRDV